MELLRCLKKPIWLVVYKLLGVQENQQMHILQIKPPLSGQLLLSIALAVTFAYQGAHVSCLAAEDTVTESELVTILRATKVVPSDSKLTASISGDEIVVSTSKKDGASDEACKIEAVLIAKTVFDSVKNDAQRAKVILFDFKSNNYSEIAVKRAEVKMFGSGQLTEKELLSSLEIKNGDGDSNDDDSLKLAPGPNQQGRVLLNVRLKKLEKQGSNISDLWPIFEKMEEAARSGDKAKTQELLQSLKPLVTARENALAGAQIHSNFQDSKATAMQSGDRNSSASNMQQRPSGPLQGRAGGAGAAKASIGDALNDTHGRNMYAFSETDVMSLNPLAMLTIRHYLMLIHDSALSGENIQSSVSSLNAAVQALRSGNFFEYEKCLNPLRTRYGAWKPKRS